jgi:hypothetical protein
MRVIPPTQTEAELWSEPIVSARRQMVRRMFGAGGAMLQLVRLLEDASVTDHVWGPAAISMRCAFRCFQSTMSEIESKR